MKAWIAAVSVVALSACSHLGVDRSWTTLIDGPKGLENFQRVGNADWQTDNESVMASRKNGPADGYLVTPTSYGDFEIHAEFWADENANSGIFLRCSDPSKPGAATCYEVNIFDKRPEQAYATGAIVNVAPVNPVPKAAGKWNTFDITAKGDHLVVIMNGNKTVDVHDSKHTTGPFALQYASGVIKFRKVRVKRL